MMNYSPVCVLLKFCVHWMFLHVIHRLESQEKNSSYTTMSTARRKIFSFRCHVLFKKAHYLENLYLKKKIKSVFMFLPIDRE